MSAYSREEFLALSAKVAAAGGLALAAGPYPALAAGTTSIRFSIWYGPGDIPIWKQVIKDFTRRTGIQVQFEPLQWATFWQKLQTQLVAGTAPDVIGMEPGVVYNYASNGTVLDLSPFFSAAHLDPRRLIVYQQLVDFGRYPPHSDKIYALPWRWVDAPLYVNLTALSKAHLPVPKSGWTWNDFLEVAKRLTTKKTYGYMVPNNQLVEPWLASDDASPLTPDLRHANFTSPRVVETIAFLQSLITKHKVAPSWVQISPTAPQDPFVSGRVAMTTQGSWMVPVYRGIKTFEWDVIPHPLKRRQGAYEGPDMVCVTSGTAKKEAAWLFVKHVVFDPHAQQLLGQTGIPVLRSNALDERYIQQQARLRPAHYRLVVDQGRYGQGFGFNAKWVEWNTAFGNLMNPIMTGKVSAQAGCRQIQQKVEQILSQA